MKGKLRIYPYGYVPVRSGPVLVQNLPQRQYQLGDKKEAGQAQEHHD